MVVTDDLLTYIKGELDAGVPHKTIQKRLLKEGWEELDIAQALKALENYGNTELSKQAEAEAVLEVELKEMYPEKRHAHDHTIEDDLTAVGTQTMPAMHSLRTPVTDAPEEHTTISTSRDGVSSVQTKTKKKIRIALILIILAIVLMLVTFALKG